MLFYEHGHTDPADIQKERQLQEERDHCKEVVFEYNNTHPERMYADRRSRENFWAVAVSTSSLKRLYIWPTETMCIKEISVRRNKYYKNCDHDARRVNIM